MKYKNTSFRCLSFLLLIAFCSCLGENVGNNPNELSNLKGRLIFPHAGEIFEYDLSDQSIRFLAERKGRQGPFFSPDYTHFATNNWPGNTAGVAVWGVEDEEILLEFDLQNTLISADKGVRVAPGAKMFSGILNPSAGQNPDLVVMDENGDFKWRLNGDGIRVKGHTWDVNQTLYITGEILQGGNAGSLFMASISDFQNLDVKIIRTFSGDYLDLPDEMAVSRDGSQIAYAFDRNIWVGGTQQGATDHRMCFEAVRTLARPVFSPDGQHIAMAMLNSNTSLRGDIHVARIPDTGSTTLTPEGRSMLPGPNSSLKSTWTSGGDSSVGWVE